LFGIATSKVRRDGAGEDFTHRLVQRGGWNLNGEHGVGQGKQKSLKVEPGPEAIDAMRAVKHALDPHNLYRKDSSCGIAELFMPMRLRQWATIFACRVHHLKLLWFIC
jgi:hypothetical protein